MFRHAYLRRLDGDRFLATEEVSGVWDVSEQHIAPVPGLLAHPVEVDRDRRRDDGLGVSSSATLSPAW